MKNGIVRFIALYAFTVVVLLLLGAVSPGVTVGFDALWAAVILTLAALFVKPALTAAFRKAAAKSAADRTMLGEKIVQYVLVYLVELLIWVAVVWLSGVRASGFWSYVLPPLLLLIGWMIYDQVDDRLRAKAGELYDVVQARVSRTPSSSAPASSAGEDARSEPDDGLTPEQRRMLDELG
ncbi:hypothetical protein [Microbacterium sp. 3J1]|uniref:hypothetical protein n=1 Tax=Microbacterium sp. 3J1 TaxID=861269 RepID=UPI000AA5B899|nr:hypothetical protein [Microbacterium sp. 3J1]